MNKPPRMPLLEPTTIRFVLETTGRGTADDDMSGLEGEIVRRDVRVAEKASAKLKVLRGKAAVAAEEPVTQDVTELQNVVWTWKVTPQSPSPLLLEVTVDGVAVINGRPVQLRPRAFSETIPVDVTPGSWTRWALLEARGWIADIDPVWKWLSGVVAALGGLLVWLRAYRRGGPAKAKTPNKATTPQGPPPTLQVEPDRAAT